MLKLCQKKMDFDSSESIDYSPTTSRMNQLKQNDRINETSQHYYKTMSFVDLQNQENDKCVENEIEAFKNEIRFMILSDKFESFEKDHIERIIQIMTKAVKTCEETSHRKKVKELLSNLSNILDYIWK